MEMHTPSPLRTIYVQRTISLDSDVLRDLQKQSRKHFLLLKDFPISVKEDCLSSPLSKNIINLDIHFLKHSQHSNVLVNLNGTPF